VPAVALVASLRRAGAEQAVVQYGVKDRKPQPVARKPVAVLARDPGDEPVGTQARQIEAGLIMV
jgi:hypothetical protein